MRPRDEMQYANMDEGQVAQGAKLVFATRTSKRMLVRSNDAVECGRRD